MLLCPHEGDVCRMDDAISLCSVAEIAVRKRKLLVDLAAIYRLCFVSIDSPKQVFRYTPTHTHTDRLVRTPPT